MLVLSRKKDEQICIGEDIVVTITEIRGDKVRIGIDAPKNITVHRREVQEAIEREKKQLAATANGDAA
jgi:carbon storage regulator